MANFSRVAEIFEQASVAFGRLAQLTIDLKQFQAQQNDGDSKTCGKWSQKEVDDLKTAISRFGADLSKIAEAVETKTINQIKQKLKTRAFQDAGLGDISFENETEDTTQVKLHETTAQNTVSVDRGRRKQALNQITESVDVHPSKRRRSNDSDDDDYMHYDTTAEAESINAEKKFRQRLNNNENTTPTAQNETAANTTTTITSSNNNTNNNISSILKGKGLIGTLSSVLKSPLPPLTTTSSSTTNNTTSNISSNVINFDSRQLKTERVGLTSSNYDPNESKYEDYDSEDSDYGGNDDCTPPGDDSESNDEHDDEDDEGGEEKC
ncbi:unnamed protein product [Trichobilharzia szidati]|nr:unnamed protein product [Trichobilharzia szidati]